MQRFLSQLQEIQPQINSHLGTTLSIAMSNGRDTMPRSAGITCSILGLDLALFV